MGEPGPVEFDVDFDSSGEPSDDGADANQQAHDAAETIEIIRKSYKDDANKAHMSDNTAQVAARARLEQFYSENKLNESEKFIGYKDDAGRVKKTYSTVDAGIADGAKFIRYNVKNLHDKQLIAKQLRKELAAMSKDELTAHTESGGINLDVRRYNLVPHAHNTMTKELLALDNGNVSTHDGKRYPVGQLVVDGNGQVHGNGIDYHYNQKDSTGKNPNNSINLLVQLANGDASLILGSAHDLLRSTKGYTSGDHPATSSYVHSKDGYLADQKTLLPVDQPLHVEMRKEALDFLQIPVLIDRTHRHSAVGAVSTMSGMNALTPTKDDRPDHAVLLDTNDLRRYKRDRTYRRTLMNRANRKDADKATDQIEINYLSDKIDELLVRLYNDEPEF